jgi:hypothetical protein
MSNVDSPALFDPALFWGLVLVILFYFHKSRKGKKEKGGRTAWSYLTRIGNDLFSFFLRGFYENKPSQSALRQKTIDNQKPTPKPLRVFAPSRGLISLPAVRSCLFRVSREDAKARRWVLRLWRNCIKPVHFLKNAWFLHLSSVILSADLGPVLTYILHTQTALKTRSRTCAGDHERSGGKAVFTHISTPFCGFVSSCDSTQSCHVPRPCFFISHEDTKAQRGALDHILKPPKSNPVAPHLMRG